jgi:hypothetical protein
MTSELEVLGIDVDGVGSPRNDNTPGSALYLVPIQLNRAPSAREAAFLVANFDRPASFTTMHRPGIARVVGDRLLLDGTTIEEVKQYHAATVRQAVDATNAAEAQQQARDTAAQDAARQKEQSHRKRVADIADDIDFG